MPPELTAPEAGNAAPDIVVAFIEDGRGRILVQPRRGDPALASSWELPGGKVAPGETRAAALAREVREETGLAVTVGELVCALCYDYGDRRVALHSYRCAPTGRPGTAAAPGPADPAAGCRWISLDDGRALPQPAANPALWDALAWLRSAD